MNQWLTTQRFETVCSDEDDQSILERYHMVLSQPLSVQLQVYFPYHWVVCMYNVKKNYLAELDNSRGGP